MEAGFAAVGIIADGHLRTQGRLEDGTEWIMVHVGPRMVATGETVEAEDGELLPVMAPDGLDWVIMRWNGPAPTPPVPNGVSVAWRSDLEEPEPYPEGLPIFD